MWMWMSFLMLEQSGLAAAAVRPGAAQDPPVRVWFNSDGNYVAGDRVKVYAKSREDGYLVVLRADAEGRVRVLFPVDPGDSQRITGGRKYELKSRAGREAFIADGPSGHGIVVAAIAPAPFRVGDFVEEGRWKLGALSAPGVRDDPEAALIDLIHRMRAPEREFEYDAETYVVSEQYARARYAYSAPGWRLYDPWFGYRRFGFFPRRVIVLRRAPGR